MSLFEDFFKNWEEETQKNQAQDLHALQTQALANMQSMQNNWQQSANVYYTREEELEKRIIQLETRLQKIERLMFDTKMSQDKITELLDVYEMCKKIGK